MASKKNTEAPAAVKIARNPSNKTARGMYDAVVAQEGTVGGKPARIALYGTKYAALEVGGEGAWEVDHDTAFGGVRAIESLKGGLDEVLVLGGDSREIQLTAGNVAVVEPEIEIVEVAPVAKVDAEIAEAFGLAGSPAVEVVAAPAVAAEPVEPVLTTLDEVRAAHEAETRGACRASVLRALRVRAGEIALGVEAGGAKRVKPESTAGGGEGKRTARMGLVEMLAKGIVKVGDEVKLRTKEGAVTTLSEGGNAADGRSLSQWATDQTGVSHNIYRSFIHVPTGKPLDDLRE